MRTITPEPYKVYNFDELSEESKQTAVEKLWDLNVDHEWWESTYDDAENVGIKIEEFDIGRGLYCKGLFTMDHASVARAIIKEHGKQCETYKTAKTFLDDFDKLVSKLNITSLDDLTDEQEGQFEELMDEFKNSILEDYRIILQKEYEYLTSEEAIIESIKANEYEFTEDGNLH